MKYYIGVDFHKQYSSVALMNEKGDIQDERKLFHVDEDKVIEYFAHFSDPGEVSVSIEATPNWYWFVDRLQDLGLTVKLVHARKAKIIAESTIKTDKLSAIALAHLDRSNFLPTAYIADRGTRAARELLRYYMSLVKIRTSIKNRVHAILSKNNIHHGFSDLFGKKGMMFLLGLEMPPTFGTNLTGYLQLLENVAQEISAAEKRIKEKCKGNRYFQRLVTIPGISHLTGLVLAVEIADIGRFSSYRKLCCYAGLVSSTYQSGDKMYHGHIIKESNKYIRYVLIQAVPKAIGKDPRLYRFYKKIERKKGKNKAKIAVARKLLVAIYFMLRDDTDYCIDKKSGYSQVSPMAKLGA